jgi:hypothetical protein
MTQGETVFYLREIHSHWSTSNLSSEKLAELEAAKLIERRTEPLITVRLTPEGERCKAAGRSRHNNDRVQLQDKPRQSFRRRKKMPPPKPW